MTTIKRLLLIISLAAAMTLPAFAYNDRITHNELSVIAAEKSVLYTDPSIMYSLGLLPIDRQSFIYTGSQQDIEAGIALYTAGGIVGRGSIDEDKGRRSLHHFFDPVYNIGMVGERSWVWMTEPSWNPHQQNSIPDAREFLTRALTFDEGDAATSLRERQLAVSSVLLSLGHTVHHMQDMAQPQHVRHDQHLEYVGAWRSRYEYYTRDRDAHIRSLAMMAGSVYPGGAEFKTSKDFWFNDANTGVAETVNRDFLSQGTNFKMTISGATTGRYSSPQPAGSTNFTIAQLFGTVPPEIQSRCTDGPVDCTVTMYATPQTQRASTYSIFDQDLVARGLEVRYVLPGIGPRFVGRLFDLNRFNFDAVHPELIRRAVSYSTGFINHFFRGKFEVTPPASGVYAVADHATGEGFTRIRATVKNITPGEALPGGKLRAIARFYRNGCYKDDLSGEWQLVNGTMTPPCANFRLPNAEITVSEEQEIAFESGQSKDLTFNFTEPIPFDAIDLMVQVYYTGTVGTEADSFALGAADVSEPTFLALINATDVFELYGAFHYADDIIKGIAADPYKAADVDENGIYNSPPDVRVDAGDVTFDVYLKTGVKAALTSGIAPGRFARIVTIVDPNTDLDVRIQYRDGAISSIAPGSFAPRIYQMIDDQTSRITPVAKRREVLQFNSSAWHRYHPVHSANVNLMPKSLHPEAGKALTALVTGMNARSGGISTTSSTNDWSKSMRVFGAIQSKQFAKALQFEQPEVHSHPLLERVPGPMVAVPAAMPVTVSHAAPASVN